MVKMYRKPISSDRYINASSLYPAQINGVIRNIFCRVLSTTNDKYNKEDTDKLTDIFLWNNFKKGIDASVRWRAKNLNRSKKAHDIKIAIPYIKGIWG